MFSFVKFLYKTRKTALYYSESTTVCYIVHVPFCRKGNELEKLTFVKAFSYI